MKSPFLKGACRGGTEELCGDACDPELSNLAIYIANRIKEILFLPPLLLASATRELAISFMFFSSSIFYFLFQNDSLVLNLVVFDPVIKKLSAQRKALFLTSRRFQFQLGLTL